MRTKLAWLSVALVTLPLAGCNSSPQSLIVGKDSHTQLPILGQTLRGTYQVNGSDGKTVMYKRMRTAASHPPLPVARR